MQIVRCLSRVISLCRLGLVSILAVALLCSVAQAQPDWSLYNTLLGRYVKSQASDGLQFNGVDYQGLGQDPRFEQLVAMLTVYPLEQLTDESQRMAFYINAYNIFAIKMVIDHYPLRSIRDVGSLFRPVWDREIASLGNEVITLDYIEHEVLRKFDDPRIHFAIVCASLSCPDLRMEPFTGERLDEQLEDQVLMFLSNQGKGLRLDNSTARVSKIFDWFEQDFEQTGGVAAFIRRYKALPANVRVRANLNYDWRLNQ